MRTERTLHSLRAPIPALWLALLGTLLAGGATSAGAADYFFFGQVFQVVDAEEAADEEIAVADLEVEPRAFPRVRLYDVDAGVLLGEADADVNGVFTVQYTQSPGATPNVEARVFHRVEGSGGTIEAERLPAAREGINDFDAVGQFEGVVLRVLADDFLSYAGAGFVSTPGVGLVFTRIGRTETQYIAQNMTVMGGLADLGGDAVAASSLGVPVWSMAPFAHRLKVYGDFGMPENNAACRDPDGNWRRADYYQVTVTPVGGTPGSDAQMHHLLEKTRTSVTTVPSFSVVHERFKIGPFEGQAVGDADDNLYWINQNVSSGSPVQIWSFPDLRVDWRSNSWAGGGNGLYEFTVKHFWRTGGAFDAPTVQQIPSGCFTGPTAPVDALIVRVDNGTTTATFDKILLRRPSGGNYVQTIDPVTETANLADAYDFNTTGLCEIIDLAGTYEVEIHFTVNQSGGYLRSYSLSATPNDPLKASVAYKTESFTSPGNTSPSDPIWIGTEPGIASDPDDSPVARTGFDRCAYIFDLVAHSRQQDGINWIGYAPSRRAYYVEP